jgi:hypothetical protein
LECFANATSRRLPHRCEFFIYFLIPRKKSKAGSRLPYPKTVLVLKVSPDKKCNTDQTNTKQNHREGFIEFRNGSFFITNLRLTGG